MAEFATPAKILGMPQDARRGTPTQQRQAFPVWVLQRPPAGGAGQFLYSNGGYGIAGAMAERATGRTWECLLQERLFDALGITAALAPAGDLSMSMSAYARFLQMHIRGLAGRDDVLRVATIRTLHDPEGTYALGWGVQRNGAGTVHFREGNAGTFHVVTLLDPQRGIAMATVTCIEADDSYVVLYATGARHLFRQSLCALERELDPAHSVRMHRSVMVRRDEVRARWRLRGAPCRQGDRAGGGHVPELFAHTATSARSGVWSTCCTRCLNTSWTLGQNEEDHGGTDPSFEQ